MRVKPSCETSYTHSRLTDKQRAQAGRLPSHCTSPLAMLPVNEQRSPAARHCGGDSLRAAVVDKRGGDGAYLGLGAPAPHTGTSGQRGAPGLLWRWRQTLAVRGGSATGVKPRGPVRVRGLTDCAQRACHRRQLASAAMGHALVRQKLRGDVAGGMDRRLEGVLCESGAGDPAKGERAEATGLLRGCQPSRDAGMTMGALLLSESEAGRRSRSSLDWIGGPRARSGGGLREGDRGVSPALACSFRGFALHR